MSSSLAAVLCFKCLVLFGLGFQAVKFATRSLGDVGMRLNTTPRNPNVLECVHEILARLVKGVYARDRGDPTASRYWKDIDYTEMDIDQFGGPDSQARKLKVSGSRGQSKPDEPIRVMVFKRCGSDNRKYLLKTDDDEEEEVYVPAPKYVVAIRGTMMNWKDWRANMNILGETICGLRPLYGPVMEVIKDVHDKCSADGDVCVAGHSLGAMLALVATRLLAKEKQIVLKAHLFNPPYISVSTLTKKAFLQVPIGLEKVLGIIPVFGPSAAAAVRRGAERLYDIHEEMVTAAAEEFLREKWDSAVASNQLLIKRGYCPHLYVNEHDSISNEYIRHFKSGVPRPTSFSSSLVNNVAALFDVKDGCAESCHRIPQAYLHTNHWGAGPIEAHKLHQWFSYPTVRFTSEFKGSGTGETP